VEPAYTLEARQAGVQGTVLLYVQVDTTGHAVNIRVLHGLGLGLDENAIEAIRTWTFSPGIKDGKPVTVEAQIEVNFRLSNPALPIPAQIGSSQRRVVTDESTPRVPPNYSLRQDGSRERKRDKLEFEGAMETLTEAGISIRLPDGRIIEAALSAAYFDANQIASLKKRFIGDIVHLRCVPIPPVYDEAEDRPRELDLLEIRFVRTPSAGELSAALASRHRFNPRNLLQVAGAPEADMGLSLNSIHLPPSPTDLRKNSGLQGGDEFIEKSRAAIAAYLAKVPNYVADEAGERYQTPATPLDWRKTDSVKAEVRFDGNRETRENIFLDDRRWTEPFVMLPGFKWRGGFGETLREIFDPSRPVRFTLSQSIIYRGKRAQVYEFVAPKDGLGAWQSGYQGFYPAYEGKVTITEDDRMVVRVESKAKEFPPAFPISSVENVITWDWVIAGSGRELLPVTAELLLVNANERQAYLVRLDYRNHRHFQASSSISFDK
jgi:TonB family protein